MGERMCIGNRFAMLEMKTFLAHFARHFTCRLDPNEETRFLYTAVTLRCDETHTRLPHNHQPTRR